MLALFAVLAIQFLMVYWITGSALAAAVVLLVLLWSVNIRA